jgi:hypothetical protein
MFQRLLHVLYTIEFLLALVAVFAVWRELGGQGHLDYMAWYWKAAIGFPAAYAVVRLTICWTLEGPALKRRVIGWGLLLVLLGIIAGLVTYYYHLNEPQDENDADPGTITPAAVRGRAVSHAPGSMHIRGGFC